jgi:hypothetical protein
MPLKSAYFNRIRTGVGLSTSGLRCELLTPADQQAARAPRVKRAPPEGGACVELTPSAYGVAVTVAFVGLSSRPIVPGGKSKPIAAPVLPPLCRVGCTGHPPFAFDDLTDCDRLAAADYRGILWGKQSTHRQVRTAKEQGPADSPRANHYGMHGLRQAVRRPTSCDRTRCSGAICAPLRVPGADATGRAVLCRRRGRAYGGARRYSCGAARSGKEKRTG